ncbi:hypothetical protein EDB19DRAFT_1825827 [Suillus lakei]|nr:hypothetical protein EDB19DRAFT_1825827 [Suillus lakei]
MHTYYVQLLPAETLCTILKAALDNVVEDDMMITPEAEHRMLEGGLPFPHTMALILCHAPEGWPADVEVTAEEDGELSTPHIGLKSLRIWNPFDEYDQHHFNILTGCAPWPECLQFIDARSSGYYIPDAQEAFFQIDYPALEIFHIDQHRKTCLGRYEITLPVKVPPCMYVWA